MDHHMSQDKCGQWHYDTRRLCRNKFHHQYRMCEPCYNKQAIRWRDLNQHAIDFFLYLQQRNLLEP